ncbi:3-oxoacyl-[acyl-carrier-protein] reductase [Candidatus Riesia pediculicola]|uniref:3-oxoacyl-[acyl-carrier-protein] reductase n=1 Tax=Riesia pediculicola (strain USDA) TaxID=515618 RepID=D4G8I4_RIEPU|nr:3-oxoacyl-[acyl-carrier-protein] reductase [Candidatus Riesia pediculicola]ADD79675.1 3-oxoacyl-[acyl-carrier-protein] reductase [Candidatus Riesia pediculicola USDA]ARC53863.1 3-ketoacyl-ACP reductase [Candidatus Riesia pediculicola]QOJ86494.1 3-oxoacyl-[acyl-carrier-protein] reductase [Candidatus Riesia pediculicola]
MSFKDKLVLVTGASNGIGMEISKLFAKNEANVIGTSTSINGVKKIDSYLKNRGKGYILNVLDKESIQKFFFQVEQDFGEVDILINNIGIVKDNLLVRMKRKDWEEVIKVNLTSIFIISKNVIKSMMKKRYGRIISIGSVVGMKGNLGQTNYSSSKSGIIGFSKSLAMEVAKYGITVNVVSPGFIDTRMTKFLDDKRKRKILSHIPIGRFGSPKEIASVVVFLASEDASYITGETVNVNGGIMMI